MPRRHLRVSAAQPVAARPRDLRPTGRPARLSVVQIEWGRPPSGSAIAGRRRSTATRASRSGATSHPTDWSNQHGSSSCTWRPIGTTSRSRSSIYGDRLRHAPHAGRVSAGATTSARSRRGSGIRSASPSWASTSGLHMGQGWLVAQLAPRYHDRLGDAGVPRWTRPCSATWSCRRGPTVQVLDEDGQYVGRFQQAEAGIPVAR